MDLSGDRVRNEALALWYILLPYFIDKLSHRMTKVPFSVSLEPKRSSFSFRFYLHVSDV